MSEKFKGKTVVITGAGTGIGRAMALECASAGAKVVCTGRRLKPIEETVKTIEANGGEAMAVTVDVTEKAQVEDMVRKTIERFGRIDILINNAGLFSSIGSVWEANPESWLSDLKVNLFGPMLCSQMVIPHMIRQDGGLIINMSSGAAFEPFPGGSSYAASKAGLLRLTDTLARELVLTQSPVTVCAIDPGFNATGMTEQLCETSLGKKWFPHVGKLIQSNGGAKAEDTAKKIRRLIDVIHPGLSGRHLSASKKEIRNIKRDLLLSRVKQTIGLSPAQ